MYKQIQPYYLVMHVKKIQKLWMRELFHRLIELRKNFFMLWVLRFSICKGDTLALQVILLKHEKVAFHNKIQKYGICYLYSA